MFQSKELEKSLRQNNIFDTPVEKVDSDMIRSSITGKLPKQPNVFRLHRFI
ncbi:MAG: hypothetical protein U5K69_03310 [Balneolaceae bacterium]|nr:hypothetical protein [Balneolaceae bacterium]